MHQRRRCFLLLSVFLFSLALPMASSTPPSIETTAVVEPRETGWQAIEPTSTQAIALKETDPVIHLAGISFDPTADAFDSIVSVLDTAGSTTLHLLQLSLSLIHI